jgi:predicted dehydrogenase
MGNNAAFEIAALADPSEEFLAVAAALAPASARRYRSHDDLLSAEPALDAVMVCTPGGLHAAPVIAAFERGLHVFCEKPVATSVEDADRMIAAAEKAGTVFFVGQQMRFDPVYRKLIELVEAGEIGAVRFVSGYLCRKDWNPRSWQAPGAHGPAVWRKSAALTGSSLLEDGLHELDILHHVAGSTVERVLATGGNLMFRDRETLDHAALAIDYANGAKVQFGFCLFGMARDEEMILVGEKGVLRTSHGRIALQREGEPEPRIFAAFTAARVTEANPAGSTLNPAAAECLAHFADCVQNGSRPLCGGREAAAVMRIALLAQKAIDERRIVNASEL